MATRVATAVRQEDRFPVKLAIDCISRDAFTTGYATNLGRGGLFVASEKPLPQNAALELTLTLPGCRARVRALGRVVWNRDRRQGPPSATPGMGVKFLSMSNDDWDRLVAFLASLPVPDVMPLISSRCATAAHAQA